MKLWQTMKLAWINIIGNRMRSFLTMLGMIIGVASVIILVSLMQSMANEMVSSYADMGINNITVSIKGRNGDTILKEEDMYEYAKKYPNTILGVAPNISFSGSIKFGQQKAEGINITGTDEKYLKTMKKALQEGRGITYSDITIRNKICVIGSYINKNVFKGNARPGDTVYVNGDEFRVAGVLKELSDSSEWSQDNCFYIPYTTAARLSGIGNIKDYLFFIKDSNVVEAETIKIRHFLFQIFHITNAYSVTNMIDMLKQIEIQQTMMTSVLAGIAGISLVVAGIGIMNIMLVSVTERTKEIGIRKSLGAKKKDIMRQFVIEAGTTSSIGGIIGIMLGTIVTIKIGDFIGMKAMPNINTVLISFGISAGIGILFGYLPANKAAKLNPIDALRSE